MSQPVFKYVDLKTVMVPDSGWHHDDDGMLSKLASSLQRHGQLQVLVVRGDLEDDTMVTLVHGHKQLGVMQTLGWTQAMAVHVGDITPVQALKMALHLELKFEVDYVRLAAAVCDMVAAGATVAEVASGSPFDSERVQHLLTLRTHDWTKFGEDDGGQTKLDWDALEALPEPLATVPVGMAAALEDARRDGVVDALEDVTDAAPTPAAPPVAPPTAAEPAAATAGEPETQPVTAAKAKRARAQKATAPAADAPAAPAAAKPAKAAKVPKAPDAQLGLF